MRLISLFALLFLPQLVVMLCKKLCRKRQRTVFWQILACQKLNRLIFGCFSACAKAIQKSFYKIAERFSVAAQMVHQKDKIALAVARLIDKAAQKLAVFQLEADFLLLLNQLFKGNIARRNCLRCTA